MKKIELKRGSKTKVKWIDVNKGADDLGKDLATMHPELIKEWDCSK